jgi:hypothetical protein
MVVEMTIEIEMALCEGDGCTYVGVRGRGRSIMLNNSVDRQRR